MNLNESQVRDFIQKIKNVIDKKEDEAFIEFEGHVAELKKCIEEALGEEQMEKLFLLTVVKDKKDWIEAHREEEWPNPEADFISSIKVVRAEDRLKI